MPTGLLIEALPYIFQKVRATVDDVTKDGWQLYVSVCARRHSSARVVGSNRTELASMLAQ